MARAKRTARADVRRRNRQTQLAAEDGVAEESASASETSARPRTAPPARPGFMAAFKLAYHPANVREDLPFVPRLVTHWSFWLPLLLMIASAAVTVAAPSSPIATFAFQTFVYPPALIAMFVVGFFAPRASYLLGGILGVANVVVFGAFLAYSGTSGLAGEVIPAETLQTMFFNAVVLSPPAGVMFSALAAWYRRFLYLSNPNRGRTPPKGKPKPNQGSRRPLFGRR